VRARRVGDAGAGFVRQHQARRVRVAALAVEAGDGGEQRHRQPKGALAACGRPGEFAPLTILQALDAETVPAAVVERTRELIDQAAAAVARMPSRIGIAALAFGADALLQHGMGDAPFLRRPEVGTAVRQPGARGFESDRRAFVLAQRLPLQALAHPGRGRTLVQLPVDGLHLCRIHPRSQPSGKIPPPKGPQAQPTGMQRRSLQGQCRKFGTKFTIYMDGNGRDT